MNRRSFFAALAALPFVARALKVVAAPKRIGERLISSEMLVGYNEELFSEVQYIKPSGRTLFNPAPDLLEHYRTGSMGFCPHSLTLTWPEIGERLR